MTRTILAIATALLSASTLFASAAQACISCSYTPEVVNTPTPGMRAKSYEKKRIQAAIPAHVARPAAKKHAPKIETAAVEPVAKKAETTEATSVKTQSSSEPGHISTASLLERGTAAPTTEATPAAPEQKVDQDVGCKKFIPAASVTVTVPCE